MRVKISYTVDIEEVEKKVAEIISNAIDDIEFSNQEAMRIRLDLSTKVGDVESKVNMLEQIRLKLASADQVLEDCYLILEGLRQARIQLEEHQNEIQDG
tara:strand:- start:185 stop:481 length:297 start_codon:yes stop_codon:yes gene_type:complete